MDKKDADLYERELDRYRETLRLDKDVAAERYGMTLINSLTPAERVQVIRHLGFEITEAVDFYNLGCQSAFEENWSEAINLFRQAAEMDPEMTEAIHNLAICYEKTGHTPQAKATWQVYLDVVEDAHEKARITDHLKTL